MVEKYLLEDLKDESHLVSGYPLRELIEVLQASRNVFSDQVWSLPEISNCLDPSMEKLLGLLRAHSPNFLQLPAYAGLLPIIEAVHLHQFPSLHDLPYLSNHARLEALDLLDVVYMFDLFSVTFD